jgi:uncharacterized protein (DUF2164 family)
MRIHIVKIEKRVRTLVDAEIPKWLENVLNTLSKHREKISAVKLVRDYFYEQHAINVGLKEAKDFIEQRFYAGRSGTLTYNEDGELVIEEPALGDILKEALSR